MEQNKFHEALGQAVALSNDRRKDMLTGALEGGSNYWYCLGKKFDQIIEKYDAEEDTTVDTIWKALEAGESLPIHSTEETVQRESDGKEVLKMVGELSLKSILEGEILMAQHYPDHYADILKEQDDATTADVWFQFVVMKELVYG